MKTKILTIILLLTSLPFIFTSEINSDIKNFVFAKAINEKIETAVSIPSDAVEFNGNYYKIYYTATTWKKAKKKCEAVGGHLATVTSEDENDFVYNLIHNKCTCWIGATDEKHEGIFKWVTNELFIYNNWDVSHWGQQPDNICNQHGDDENYLSILEDNGCFNDWCGKGKLAYICEWEGLNLQTGFIGNTYVGFTWSIVKGAARYKIEQYKPSSDKWKTLSSSTIFPLYIAKNLKANTTYQFRVTALTGNNKALKGTVTKISVTTPKTVKTSSLIPNLSKSDIEKIWVAVIFIAFIFLLPLLFRISLYIHRHGSDEFVEGVKEKFRKKFHKKSR